MTELIAPMTELIAWCSDKKCLLPKLPHHWTAGEASKAFGIPPVYLSAWGCLLSSLSAAESAVFQKCPNELLQAAADCCDLSGFTPVPSILMRHMRLLSVWHSK